jgi:dolichol-phosphate mannosyltransferase
MGKKVFMDQAVEPKVSIILATLNERENILELISGIFSALPDGTEIIVVDDDSTDGTWQEVEKLNDDRIKLIRRIHTRGLASAINRGIIESRGGIIGWMDCDLCMPPSLLPKMIAHLDENDVVIGSRYVSGGEDNRSQLRVITSRAINRLAGLVLGYGIRDYDSGFIVLKREVLNQVTLLPEGYGAYFIEFIYNCCQKGLKVYEYPYQFHDRTRGESKSMPSLRGFLHTGLGYINQIFMARLKRLQ